MKLLSAIASNCVEKLQFTVETVCVLYVVKSNLRFLQLHFSSESDFPVRDYYGLLWTVHNTKVVWVQTHATMF